MKFESVVLGLDGVPSLSSVGILNGSVSSAEATWPLQQMRKALSAEL